MFLGTDMFSGKYAMAPNPVSIGSLTDISLKSGTYDHLFLSSNPQKTAENIHDQWEFSTKINADYTESMDGGNTGFSLKNTDTIVIKCREMGTMDWITVCTVPINRLSDFNFIKEYNYAKADTDYDFMIISSIGGIQNSYEFAQCRSDFEGICILDKDSFYKTLYNIDPITITRNSSEAVLSLLNDTHPVIISNSGSNYDSGSISAVFLKLDNKKTATGSKATKYRQEIMDWLTNKKAKILKLDNGATKLIRVVGSPVESDSGFPELKKIQFDFVAIGDADNEKDLYKNNLSNVEPDRW